MTIKIYFTKYYAQTRISFINILQQIIKYNKLNFLPYLIVLYLMLGVVAAVVIADRFFIKFVEMSPVPLYNIVRVQYTILLISFL